MQSFVEKQKSVNLGPKMSYMKTFRQKSEKNYYKFETSTLKYFKMQRFVEINILQLLDQKYFIWVFVGCYFENIISCVKFMQLCMCDN